MKAALSAAILVVVSFALSSCGGAGGGTSYSYQNVTLSIAPRIASLPVNGSQTFTATVTNAPPILSWGIANNSSSVAGTYTDRSTAGAVNTYLAPATPPIYSASQVTDGAVQGRVTVQGIAANTAGGLFGTYTSDSVSFIITAPTVTVGVSPMSANVARLGTQQFTGYAVGNVNGAIAWQVNGVTGGGTATGTISAAGLYTAPAALPMTGSTVTVMAVSVADPTKSASTVVTIS